MSTYRNATPITAFLCDLFSYPPLAPCTAHELIILLHPQLLLLCTVRIWPLTFLNGILIKNVNLFLISLMLIRFCLWGLYLLRCMAWELLNLSLQDFFGQCNDHNMMSHSLGSKKQNKTKQKISSTHNTSQFFFFYLLHFTAMLKSCRSKFGIVLIQPRGLLYLRISDTF